ncbi:hypothetical protein R6Q57_029773 [Mikania cordata]
MKKVRCRLYLLKNKRCCIATQLRNDVAQLIKHGHYQTAFDRVGQIYKDECIIAVYDLLDHFCEFVTLQLSYIRRTKDCPNDINEAISSLIFASARCGELPELLRIRKLFRKRYGERFEARALGLLPGNLVNFQIRENLSINKVPNEVKHKLLEEITATVLQTEPLTLKFASKQVSKGTGNQQIADVDLSSNESNFDHINPTADSSSACCHVEAKSSSSKEIIYLGDDIKEFQSPLMKDISTENNEKDQRVFMFTSSATLLHGAGNPKIINLLISLMEKVGDSMKVRRGSCSDHHENGLVVDPINGEDDGVMMMSGSYDHEPSLSHVHPKLPDYDELAATFMALKKQKFQSQKLISAI